MYSFAHRAESKSLKTSSALLFVSSPIATDEPIVFPPLLPPLDEPPDTLSLPPPVSRAFSSSICAENSFRTASRFVRLSLFSSIALSTFSGICGAFILLYSSKSSPAALPSFVTNGINSV